MESFEQLTKQYSAMIHKIIHSLHIYKNKQEFYQTGLIALWEASITFDSSKGCFTSYAYKYIKGRILRELTKETTFEDHSVYPKEEYWETVEDDLLAEPCEMLVLMTYCDGMTENQIKWVVYTFVKDFSITDIAAKEQVSPSAVKQWRKGATEKGLNTINGPTGGASGWETDQMDKSTPKNAVLLAQGINTIGKGADMIYYDHPAGGGVFSVGSITFGGSLVIDPQLSKMVQNVIERFNK